MLKLGLIDPKLVRNVKRLEEQNISQDFQFFFTVLTVSRFLVRWVCKKTWCLPLVRVILTHYWPRCSELFRNVPHIMNMLYSISILYDRYAKAQIIVFNSSVNYARLLFCRFQKENCIFPLIDYYCCLQLLDLKSFPLKEKWKKKKKTNNKQPLMKCNQGE